jgi:uracil-DNA glycosylase
MLTPLIDSIPGIPTGNFLPKKEDVFKVFRQPREHIRIVLIGQDPYDRPGNATGLAFGIPKTVSNLTPSLLAIRHEIEKERIEEQKSELWFDKRWRTLEHWERQGIFLLNSSLTVLPDKPGCHVQHWEQFIQKTIEILLLSEREEGLIWLLWGKQAQQIFKSTVEQYALPWISSKIIYSDITQNRIIFPENHVVLESAHPASEFYRGTNDKLFYGNQHFKYVNFLLKQQKKEPIKW